MLLKSEATVSKSINRSNYSRFDVEIMNFKFVVVYNINDGYFHIQKESNEFEIVDVADNNDQNHCVTFDQKECRFFTPRAQNLAKHQYPTYPNVYLKFTILFEREFEEADKFDNWIIINHQLFFPAENLRSMKVNQFHEEEISLKGYENFKFKMFVKKIAKRMVEILIENPYQIEIYGQKTDFRTHHTNLENIHKNLCFIFSMTDYQKASNITNSPTLPDSTTPKTDQMPLNAKKNYEVMSNPKYADVIITAKDGVQTKSHRNVLGKYSEVFDKIFEETQEYPVTIQIDKFDSSTIKTALEFCYGNNDAIQGNAEALLEFANDFAITELKHACCDYCSKEVDATNVCEVIKIAYSQNFKELKQKCKKIMVERKAEIDKAKLKALPSDILFDVFVEN